jgi:hypothetical protein
MITILLAILPVLGNDSAQHQHIQNSYIIKTLVK